MPALVRAYAEERVGIDVPATTVRRALRRVRTHTEAAGAGPARVLAA
ncbi:hypothetical protein [Streptomyces achromogenes]